MLGNLRLHLGDELGLIDEDAFAWVWITDFPMFDWSEEEGRWQAQHHPFTRPAPGWEDRFDEEPAAARAYQYDLVGNGNELGGGSFRIHEAELQERVFATIALTPEEQRAKFGFLLDALAMGAPPHGGIAFGIDRMMMVLAKEQNLRDTIAFPKNQAGVDPMSGAPSEVPAEQLAELGHPGRRAEEAMTSFGLRFAAEVAFLALLALAVGLAELETPWIVAVMVVGWLLVAVVEWLAWRTEVGAEAAERQGGRGSARRADVVGHRGDPRAGARRAGLDDGAAERRPVSTVLAQRLLALAGAALLAGVVRRRPLAGRA